jgi:response regulator of citrate/malate metabolism
LVLVVEDEPLVARAHGTYVERVPGFSLAGVVNGGGEALRFIRSHPVDVVLLDFNLPDMHGLDVCRAIRGAGLAVDVIAVTATRDLAAVRTAVSLGIVQYILKPFTFQSLREKLERYQEYRGQVTDDRLVSGQGEVDRAMAVLRGAPSNTLPPGVTTETLDAVARALHDTSDPLSATEVADACGVSRVTARRYLEHLADTGMVVRRQRYRSAGRPEVEYTWRVSHPLA